MTTEELKKNINKAEEDKYKNNTIIGGGCQSFIGYKETPEDVVKNWLYDYENKDKELYEQIVKLFTWRFGFEPKGDFETVLWYLKNLNK